MRTRSLFCQLVAGYFLRVLNDHIEIYQLDNFYCFLAVVLVDGHNSTIDCPLFDLFLSYTFRVCYFFQNPHSLF